MIHYDILSPYLREVNIVKFRIVSFLNRDKSSPSCGSFDRNYWGWKKRDFSDATLQYSALLLLKSEDCISPVMAEWISDSIMYTISIQKNNGSFDQVYPNENHPMVGLDIASLFVAILETDIVKDSRKNKIRDALERLLKFSLPGDENYGLISNHLAHYAYEYLNAYKIIQNSKLRDKAKRYLELIIANTSKEGWHKEYGGADPGYQTRTLRYLVKCAKLLESEEIWDLAKRSARFIETVLMPDNSIHPMLGCRSTALLYPSGFEELATRYPEFQSLAARIRTAWQTQTVPMPSWLDFDNAIRLADDALDASKALEQNSAPMAEAPSFDWENRKGEHLDLPEAGLYIRRNQNYALYCGAKLGGSLVVYQKNQQAMWSLIYEDSGYLLTTGKKQNRYLTRIPDNGKILISDDRKLVIESDFYASLHDEVTPVKLIILRLLNITVLRFQWVGDLFRKILVHHLISGRKCYPVKLRRTIELHNDSIHVIDQIQDLRRQKNRSTENLQLCRRLTGIHMASARYFQRGEIQETIMPWTKTISEWTPGEGCRLEIRIKL